MLTNEPKRNDSDMTGVPITIKLGSETLNTLIEQQKNFKSDPNMMKSGIAISY